MEEFHGGKERSTTTTRRPGVVTTDKTWPIVPTGFEHPMEEEEETTAMPELEVVEEEEVTLTPREERARKRRNKTISVSQRTYVLGGGAAVIPATAGDRNRSWSTATMVWLAVGLLLAVAAVWWLFSWAAPILSCLWTILGWLNTLLAALLSWGAPGDQGPPPIPEEAPSNGSMVVNITEGVSPWNLSESGASFGSERSSYPTTDPPDVDPTAPPAEEADLIDRAWEEEQAEMERRFGRRVADIRGRSRSPSPSGSSTRLSECGCKPPCVCKA